MFWKRKEAPAAASAVAPLPALTGAPLKFNSVEFRDGQQSLFATRMTTEDMLPILPLMDEIGYEEYFFGRGVCLIEWASLIGELIPEGARRVRIEKDTEKGFDYRRITVQ